MGAWEENAVGPWEASAVGPLEGSAVGLWEGGDHTAQLHSRHECVSWVMLGPGSLPIPIFFMIDRILY